MKNSKELEEARTIKRWKVQDIDRNAWRQNLIDKRSVTCCCVTWRGVG